MNKNNIDHMVDRFLTWEFPADFNPDGAIAFNRNPDYPMPVGTNLLTATQAKAMIEYIVEGMTYTQADVDAAVAAALEKAAEFFRQKAENLRNGPTAPWQAEAIAQFEYASNICSHMQPDALAEHDAKVRADALREALRQLKTNTVGVWCSSSVVHAIVDAALEGRG